MHLKLYLWTKIQALSFGVQKFVKMAEKLPFILIFQNLNVEGDDYYRRYGVITRVFF